MELEYMAEYMCKYFKEDTPTGKIITLHKHSDNTSHFNTFKSKIASLIQSATTSDRIPGVPAG
eukprot:8948096-Ditylum_brightwellii.AAC.1